MCLWLTQIAIENNVAHMCTHAFTMEESIRMAEDRDKWRKYEHGVVNPRMRTAEEQNMNVWKMHTR